MSAKFITIYKTQSTERNKMVELVVTVVTVTALLSLITLGAALALSVIFNNDTIGGANDLDD